MTDIRTFDSDAGETISEVTSASQHDPDQPPISLNVPGLLDGVLGHHAGGPLPQALLGSLKERLEGHPALGPEMKSLWAMLHLVLQRSERTPGGDRSQFHLLNLACGPCREATVLSAFFARPERTVHQFAMDLRAPQIDKAQRRHAALEKCFQEAGIPQVRRREESSTIEFLAEDATKLVGYGQIPANFDTVFIRHQNYYHDPVIWRQIFEFALHATAEDGVLMITSYFDREHLLAIELLRKLGATLLASERNPRSKPLPRVPGMSVDRHVAVLTKPHL